LLAEDAGASGDVGDVDQHARAELPPREGLGVPAQCPLVAGAAGEVSVRAGLQAVGRQALEVRDVDRLGDAGEGIERRGWEGLGPWRGRSGGSGTRSRRWTTPTTRGTCSPCGDPYPVRRLRRSASRRAPMPPRRRIAGLAATSFSSSAWQ